MSSIQPIIDSPENIVCLCSNCHKRLHYGKIEDVRDMLKQLWDDKNVGKRLRGDELNKAIKVNNDKDAFKWLLKTYYSE